MANDREAVARQLGRDPKPFHVAARCPSGLPSVIENETTREMPTRFWITCPHLDKEIARVEATGGVRQAQEALGDEAVDEAHERHRALYGNRVAGVREGGYVKCLHAFTAIHLSGAVPNPVAEWTLQRLRSPYPENECCSKHP
ncbi:MAG: DUF501 domain-containing protein [Rubrobacteraceae bacterium]